MNELTSAESSIESLIRVGDVATIMGLMFGSESIPAVRPGFKTEGRLWDFKSDIPYPGRESENSWAHIAADLLGFYNNRGGLVIFGISDALAFVGCKHSYDPKRFNDRLRKYLGDLFWVSFHREYIQSDQRYLGVALVNSRGPIIGRFSSAAPLINNKSHFEVDGTAIRENDSTRIYGKREAGDLARRAQLPLLDTVYAVDEPRYRILSPGYQQFVPREELCELTLSALKDPRAYVASLMGIGGVGKTALATWAVLEAYDRGYFDFIVSTTAKDRELTANAGITPVSPQLTDFDSLLDTILEVVGFPEHRDETTQVKERKVRELLANENALLFVDNLETVGDRRTIDFLNNLPLGVRAITTSRRASVRKSVVPIDVGSLSSGEIDRFIASLADLTGFAYVKTLTASQREEIGTATDGIPLAIRWIVGRSKNTEQLLHLASDLAGSGKRSEELLEFSFRRLFDEMSKPEKEVLLVLSLFQKPLLREAILVGCGTDPRVADAIDDLQEDALVQQIFDPDVNDFSYTVMPITRKFGMVELDRDVNLQEKLRRRLSDYYEARDVRDDAERILVRELRAGKTATDQNLVDLAFAAERRGDWETAERLYEDALKRNPKNWRAAKLFGEFYRHKRENLARALALYEQCIANAPARGRESATIFREYAILKKDSGSADSLQVAIDYLGRALREAPGDGIALFYLGALYESRGMFNKAIELLEPNAAHQNAKTREKILPILAKSYRRVGRLVDAAKIESDINPINPNEALF